MANKIFKNGKWRFVTEKGKVGDVAPDFDSSVDVKFIEEGLGDLVPVRPKSAPVVVEPPKPTVLKPGQKEYKVVTQADQWFMGKFSPDRMNHLLNLLASEGWKLVAVAAADRATWFGSFGGSTRQEMVVFLEREVLQETTLPQYEATLADKL
jgi:hypothetical protein